MSSEAPTNVQQAEVVLPCVDLQRTVDFFVQRLAFRLDSIYPADDPRVAVLSGHGMRLRLERGSGAPLASPRAGRSPTTCTFTTSRSR